MDAHRPRLRGTGAGVLVGGATITLVLGVLAALVGGLVAGAPAGRGALIGTLLVVVVSTGGTALVHVVAGAVPAASLLIALLTYTVQLLLVLVAFLGLERSGLLTSALDRQWLGGAVIGAVLVSVATQVGLTLRSRVPAYDEAEGGRG